MREARMTCQSRVHLCLRCGRGVALLAGLVLATACEARVWQVYLDGSGDAPFIQAAVDSAANGDVILVGPGAYQEVVVIYDKSLEVRSAAGAAATSLQLFGTLERNAPFEETVIVDGFTMVGDSSGFGLGAFKVRRFEMTDCMIRGNRAVAQLGHLWSAVVRDCVFEDNIDTSAGDLGGGALMMTSALNSPGYLIENCVFRNNETTTGAPGDGYGGGGALAAGGVEYGPILIRDCLFDGNRAPTGGAAFLTGYVTVENCTFVNNVSGDGAVFMLTPTRDHWGVYSSIFAFNSLVGLYAPSVGRCGCNAYWRNELIGLSGQCSLGDGWGHFWDVDPMFCDPKGDYRLAKGSPLLGPFQEEEHSQCLAPIGAYGEGCEISPVFDASWGQIKARYLR